MAGYSKLVNLLDKFISTYNCMEQTNNISN